MKIPFFNKKKKEVPQELPDLISDDIEKSSGEINNFLKENESKASFSGQKERDEKRIEEKKEEISPKQNFVEPLMAKERSSNPRPIPRSSQEIVSRLIESVNRTNNEPEEVKEIVNSNTPTKSFFDELNDKLVEELGDLSKLEEWYENKFLPQDILSNMRKYWEKQKTEAILDKVGRDFQEKIAFKISKLQELEKVWQSVYFELIEKEHEIKEQEEELKTLLKDLVQVCKDKRKNLDGEESKKGLGEPSKNEEKKE